MEQDKRLRENIPARPDFQLSYTFPEVTGGSSYVTAAHWHEHMELLYIVKGELRVHIQGSWAAAGPGQIVVVNAGQIHSIPEKSEGTFYGCLIPHKSLCSRMGLNVEQLGIAPVVTDQAMAQAAEEIFRELREKPPYYKTRVQAKVLLLLTELARQWGSPCPAPGAERRAALVKAAVEYVAENYPRPISTGDICAALGFDKSYLCNTFKAITGTTILEHLNMVRCEHARELLLAGEGTVAECAARCGFRHLSYFTKTYKRYAGQLPSETGKAPAQN